MAATNENPIVFYDISDKDGKHWTPNTCKIRLTLNYKGLPYRVEYLKIEDVEPTLKAMGIPPTSKTFPYYTLPMIADPSSEPNGKPTYVSESFQIAMYLDDKYPSPKYPAVLPAETRALQKIFIETYFPSIFAPMYPILVSHIPTMLDASSQEYMYRSRGGQSHFAPLSPADETQRLAEVREKWEGFAKMLEASGAAGPWIMGERPTFVDFVLGGGFSFWRRVDGQGTIWGEVAGWQGGRWDEYWRRIEVIENKSVAVA